MTPFEFGILMHYANFVEEHPAVESNVPIWSETREMFLCEGLLEVFPSGYGATYRTTDRGNVFLNAALNLPLPVQCWVMPDAKQE